MKFFQSLITLVELFLKYSFMFNEFVYFLLMHCTKRPFFVHDVKAILTFSSSRSSTKAASTREVFLDRVLSFKVHNYLSSVLNYQNGDSSFLPDT